METIAAAKIAVTKVSTYFSFAEIARKPFF
jgi:hypothetical protein